MVRGQGTCGISKAKPKDQWNGKPLPEREDWEESIQLIEEEDINTTSDEKLAALNKAYFEGKE